MSSWSTGTERRDTLQKFGIWGFCQNFLQKYCDSLKRDSIFWQGSPMVLGNIAKLGFFGVLRMARIAKFGYLGDPNNQITKYLVIRVGIFGYSGDPNN